MKQNTNTFIYYFIKEQLRKRLNIHYEHSLAEEQLLCKLSAAVYKMNSSNTIECNIETTLQEWLQS